jgi:tetratricopeptide (TPR) repeat protein
MTSLLSGTKLKPALLLLALLVVYRPALDGEFLWDDADNIAKSAPLREPGGLRRIWFEPGATQQYFPALHTLWWLEWRAFGDDPRGYHVVNLLLHFTAACLLARVVSLFGLPGPWFTAALFALHPLCVESVAWITEGKNTLSLCFLLAALAAYLRSEGFPLCEAAASRMKSRSGDDSDVHVLESFVSSVNQSPAPAAIAARPTAWYCVTYYCASLGLFTLAVLSKTNAVALPGVILVLLAWRRGRLTLRDVAGMLPMIAIGAAVALVVVGVERRLMGDGRAEFDWPWIERIIVAGQACWFYLAKIFWPHPLTFIYPRWPIDPHDATARLWPLAAVALPLVLWSFRKKLGSAPLVALLIFGGTLLPVLGLMPIYGQIFSYVADHWTYLSLIPIVVLFGSGLAYVVERAMPSSPQARSACYSDAGSSMPTRQSRDGMARRLAKVGAWGMLTMLAYLTWRQTPIYRTEIALWTDTLAKNPACWLAHNNLALQLIDEDRPADAARHLAAALELRPRFKEAYVNRGLIAAEQGRRADAAADFRRALELDPQMADAHANLAMLLIDAEQLPEAVAHLRAVLRRNPRFPQARASLGLLLARTGQVSPGLAELHLALEQDPQDLKAMTNLGIVLAGAGRGEEAAAVFQRVLELEPHHAAAQAGIGNLLLARGDTAGAEIAYRTALDADPRNADVQYNLANVLVRGRQIDAAIDAYRRALQIAPAHAAAHLNLATVLSARGRRDEAERHVREVLATRPNDPQARALLKKLTPAATAAAATSHTN